MKNKISGNGKIYELANLIMGSITFYRPNSKYAKKNNIHQNNMKKILNEKVVSKKEFIACHKSLLEMSYNDGYNQAVLDYQQEVHKIIMDNSFLNMLKNIAEVKEDAE